MEQPLKRSRIKHPKRSQPEERVGMTGDFFENEFRAVMGVNPKIGGFYHQNGW